MTLVVSDSVPLDGAQTGGSRSPFLNYLNGEFAKLKVGQSFLVSEQQKCRELAALTARGILTNKGLASRIAWAHTRWSKLNGNKTRLRTRREGADDYRLHVVHNPQQQGEMNV